MDANYEEEGRVRLERFRRFCDLKQVGELSFVSEPAPLPPQAPDGDLLATTSMESVYR